MNPLDEMLAAFDAKEGKARGSDPFTSHEAAEQIDASHLEFLAYRALAREYPRWLTYFEWSVVSGIKYASLTPRGKSLRLKGFVECVIMPGMNDLGVIKNLMHFRIVKI